ncbi:MAG: hypothetical protein IPG17_17135 [Sandaracinaceae bacterium]|nr:hypothetical protein [Sandaracinaceae bacterium]MBP7685519.1 hypothetical protein [Deltaproteobacteria bacterium]
MSSPVLPWPRHALLLALSILVLATNGGPLSAQDIPVPAGNRRNLTEAPPRPGMGDVEERARVLLAAIVADDPARAMDFFMPREIFAAIKGISDPDGLHARIVRMYENDIHTLHGTVPADAEFVRFEFSGRRSWVVLREETNRLPYWAQRHNHIVYRSGGQEHRILVRTMIAWDERWYITHLSDFTRVGP